MKQTHIKGLTAVELIIMLAVLGVVATITLPKFRTMIYQSHEGHTKSNLGELRGALAIYYSDNFGLYPSDEGTPATRLSSILVPRYMKAMPSTELTHLHSKKMKTVQDHFDDQGDWAYSIVSGFVAVNCTHKDTKGSEISNW